MSYFKVDHSEYRSIPANLRPLYIEILSRMNGWNPDHEMLGVKVGAGQCVVTLQDLARATGTTRKNVHRQLKSLPMFSFEDVKARTVGNRALSIMLYHTQPVATHDVSQDHETPNTTCDTKRDTQSIENTPVAPESATPNATPNISSRVSKRTTLPLLSPACTREEEVKEEDKSDIPDVPADAFEIVEQCYLAVGLQIPPRDHPKRQQYISHLAGIGGMLKDHDREKLSWVMLQAIKKREIVRTFTTCTLGNLPLVLDRYERDWMIEQRERASRIENERLRQLRKNEVAIPEEVWKENIAKIRAMREASS